VTELEFPVTMACIYGLRKEEVLGHSTITTTEGIYAHFDDSKHKATTTKLSNYLSD
jgi:integrase